MACRTLVLPSRIQPEPSSEKFGLLTTGLPRKPLNKFFLIFRNNFHRVLGKVKTKS